VGRDGWRIACEDCLSLSVSKLRDLIRGGPGSFVRWAWWWGDRCVLRACFDLVGSSDKLGVRLRYTLGDDELDYIIPLTSTRPNFGGRRWWFVCPLVIRGRDCGRRVGKLYLPLGARYFGCRTCYNLTYRSCKDSHKYDALYRRLGADVGLPWWAVKRMMEDRYG
jgi:hypothetical protein